ncbi:MAG: FKBP-type peptidyl-prolyl cis-trans isomerase [Arachnia sp.]
MTLSPRLVASVCLTAGLFLTSCSSDTPGSTSAESQPSASGSASDTAAKTGGACDATVTSESPATEADAAASQAALGTVSLAGDAAAAPTASFEAPLAVTSEVATVADEGSGAALEEGQLITFNYLVCDVVTGEKLHSTWGLTSDTDVAESYTLSADTFGDTLAEALLSAKVGARVLWGQPGASAEESYTGEATNGNLYVLTITDAITLPESASGTAVTPTDTSLPAITLKDGKPAVSVPSSFSDPTKLVVQPLIEGEGPVVEAGQTVRVKYTGWLTDGTQFDSSWDREAPDNVFAFTVGAGEVIDGWDQGVAGQKVGSRVLLVVPAELGYGEEGGGDAIPANATLIFVVDILAAS